MPKNGKGKLASAATSKAKTPDELYDTLNETQQEVWDLIGHLGFKPRRDENLQWWADATQSEGVIGPKATQSDLAEAVQKFVSDRDGEKADTDAPKVEKLKENSKGDRYLDGMEPIVDPEIAAAAGAYHAIKTERCQLTAQEVSAKDVLAEVCHRKKELFKADPDNTNHKIYKVGDITVRVANEFKEKITTEIVEVED